MKPFRNRRVFPERWIFLVSKSRQNDRLIGTCQKLWRASLKYWTWKMAYKFHFLLEYLLCEQYAVWRKVVERCAHIQLLATSMMLGAV